MIELAKRTGVFRHIPVPMGKRLLDVGCGAGWFLRISKKLGASSKAWSRANTPPDSHGNRACVYFTGRWSHTFEQAPGATQFDIITANHVVEHVPEPVETLRAIKRLLAPGGFAWIAVPNASYPICGALKGLWHITDLPYHLMQFTPLSMAEAGRGNDFDITVVLLPVDFSSLCCAKNA